eukprot:m.146170 g.146170  ORF g.146170 m.146170 type:complete len:197 (+) comp24303_c0_seq6:485-1075(+)
MEGPQQPAMPISCQDDDIDILNSSNFCVRIDDQRFSCNRSTLSASNSRSKDSKLAQIMQATAGQTEVSLSMNKKAFVIILHFLRTGVICGVAKDTTVFQLCLTEGKRLRLAQFLQALNQECSVTRNKYYSETTFFNGAKLSFCNVANNEFLTSSETMFNHSVDKLSRRHPKMRRRSGRLSLHPAMPHFQPTTLLLS